MDISNKLKNLLEGQEKILSEYEQVVKEFETNDMFNQNIQLKKEIETCKKQIDEIESKYSSIKTENQRLRVALREQIIDEKRNIISISRAKIETYFDKVGSKYVNSLLELEQKTKQEIEKIRTLANKELAEEAKDFVESTDKLLLDIRNRVAGRIANFNTAKQKAKGSIDSEMYGLAAEDISEEVLQKRIKQNDLEIKIGLSWINKIGVLLILAGVAAALKYAYSNFFNESIKGIFVFIIGLVFISGGEWFCRKDKGVFAQGLTGGGIGILYYGVFSSYFILEIFSINAAILVSILVTAAAFGLSLRYNSKTICAFALIGGFLPFFAYGFSFGISGSEFYIVMGYLFLLNSLTMLISLYKKWNIVNGISFVFNIPTLIYLVFSAPNEVIGILYSVLTFTLYVVITLAYAFRYKVGLKLYDTILLGFNTFISCIIIFILFIDAGFGNFKGLLAVTFCAIYYVLGKLSRKYIKDDKGARILFYLTSYMFAVLIVPFQFDIAWISMGWLVEGVFLVVFGFRNRIKWMELGGWLIFTLCIMVFVVFDTLPSLFGADTSFFDYKYLAVMAGLLLALFNYIFEMKDKVEFRFSTRGKMVKVLKYFTTINFWIYVVYTSNMLFGKFVSLNTNEEFYRLMLFSVVSVGVTYLINNLKILKDRFIDIFSTVLLLLVDFICICINMNLPVMDSGSEVEKFAALIILMAYNMFAFLNIKTMVTRFLKVERSNMQVLPLFLTVYLLGNITAVLITQFNLGEYNLLFSILYVVAAFISIAIGFRKNYILLRRFGLGLSILATGKLFIYDLAFLSTEGKIASYFAFGVVLIGISFIYQRFKKSLDTLKITERV